jgi:osmotically-inducible protein OsmY
VITENGIVYLMGLVSRQEANRATSLVQSTSGVQKIIKLFQYTD